MAPKDPELDGMTVIAPSPQLPGPQGKMLSHNFLFFCFVFFFFFRAEPAAYGGFQDGAGLELQPPAYTTATAPQDPSLMCDLHHSSWQRRIRILTSWALNLLSHNGNSIFFF